MTVRSAVHQWDAMILPCLGERRGHASVCANPIALRRPQRDAGWQTAPPTFLLLWPA